MATDTNIGIGRATFRQLAGAYRKRWPVRMCAVDAEGGVVFSGHDWPRSTNPGWPSVLACAVNEAVRWGEATVSYGPNQMLLWAAPLMHNARVLGGLVAGLYEQQLFADDAATPTLDTRLACAELRQLAERKNLTNAALLEARRAEYLREQHRAEAIAMFKGDVHYTLRKVYMTEEPQLIAAVRSGDRGAARAALNRILTAIIYHSGERFDLIKSFFMELVATVCRTAVEVGGDTSELLGRNFAAMAQLSRIETLEDLTPWLGEMLERTMDSIQRTARSAGEVVLSGALAYMQQHLEDPIGRDDVARAVGLSPTYFSRQFKQYTGRSYSEALAVMRVNKAAELLARSDLTIGRIALDCGFRDQSYFTKVFHRNMRRTPLQYRREHS